MLTKNIKLKLFRKKKLNENLKKKLTNLLNEENLVIKSLKKEYKNDFDKKTISKFKNFINYRVIGMGGSSLGTQAIYDFLEHKINKKFEFLDNLKSHTKKNKKKNYLNLIISKSGNTTETIINTNIFVKNLSEMPINFRPIHCSDVNSLQFYIKDEDSWNKDNENFKINKSIQDITQKQIKQIMDWQQEHPNWHDNDKEKQLYMEMVCAVMGCDEDDDTIKNLEVIKKEIGANTYLNT